MTATFVLVLRVGLAVVLYYFLWRIIQTLWLDIKQQGKIVSAQKKTGVHIHAVTDAGDEHKFNFWQTEVLMGRGPHCNISLKDESLSASHARISFHHSQWWLEDLGSRNGTFLNKNRINTPTVVISGDKFKCGNTTFTLQIDNFNDQSSKQKDTESGADE